jgi:hypothetical protein
VQSRFGDGGALALATNSAMLRAESRAPRTRLRPSASARVSVGCAPAPDDMRACRGAVGSRVLRWHSDSAAKLITRACSRVVSTVPLPVGLAPSGGVVLSRKPRAHPMARQRGGRPRWPRHFGGERRARARRRSCGREGSHARGPRADAGARPGKDGARAGGAGHAPQTELAESEAVSGDRTRPPQTKGPNAEPAATAPLAGAPQRSRRNGREDVSDGRGT